MGSRQAGDWRVCFQCGASKEGGGEREGRAG